MYRFKISFNKYGPLAKIVIEIKREKQWRQNSNSEAFKSSSTSFIFILATHFFKALKSGSLFELSFFLIPFK